MRKGIAIVVGAGLLVPVFIYAWTGPTATAPGNNVAAPVNVDSTGQSKSGWLGIGKSSSPLTELDVNGIAAINGLAIYGNTLLQASSYLNWGGTAGVNGYGLRDNGGTLEFRNSGETGGPNGNGWKSLQAVISGLGGGAWLASGNNIYNTNTGNVGIGTATPTSKLYVYDNSGNGPPITSFTGNSTIAGLRIQRYAGAYYTDLIHTTGSGGEGFSINVGNGSTVPEIARFNSNGNVGIGTASPQAALDVANGIAARGINYTTGAQALELGCPSSSLCSVSAVTGSTRAVLPLGIWGSPTTFYGAGGTGAPLMTILSSGNVGIGTASPSQKLMVNGNVRIGSGGTSDFILKPSATPAVSVGGSGTASIITTSGTGAGAFHVGVEIPANDSGDGFYVTTDANTDGIPDTVALKINAAGNVGLGTTNPGQKLSVAGTIESTSGGVKFPDGTTQTTAAGAGTWTTSGSNIYNSNSGNVGIGTASPGTKLHILSGLNDGIRVTDGTRQGFLGPSGAGGIALWTQSNHNLSFGTNDSQRMTIDNSGNVGIGTVSPTQKLDVAGNITAPLIYDRDNTGYYLDLNSTSRINYGIFDNTYAYGWMQAPIFYDANDNNYYVDANGTTRLNTVNANGYFHISDANEKKDVKTSGGLSLIERLHGVVFKWKKDGTDSAGVIAQEVEKVLPSAVRTGSDGVKSVEYDQFVAPLIESVKELSAQNKAQQKEIDDLKSQVAELQGIVK